MTHRIPERPAPLDGAGVVFPAGGDVWRILVVESDLAQAEPLMAGLRRCGHQVSRVETGAAALQAYGDMDLVLIGLELPDIDGLEVCRLIRAAADTPVIALSTLGSELDRVLGLQAGADDYLVKPYGFRELVARAQAVMRRARPRSRCTGVIARGPLRIDVGAREVSLDGRPIEVTRTEFDILHLLASDSGNVVPRKRLMQQIWGDSWSRRTVDTHVSSLRGKLGCPKCIVTVRGVGFRLGDC
ncbi:response regulator transcription factor [Streptomyces laurentii]|uniref:response regulator transcription factor n=1 Tax=Streptomyces laurentii TaxID=39478 RepID=UPI0036A47C39